MSTSNSTSSAAGSDDWMQLVVNVPHDDGAALLLVLKEKLGFRNSLVDFCELERTTDEARVHFGPAPDPVKMRRQELKHLEYVHAQLGESGLTPIALRRLEYLRNLEAGSPPAPSPAPDQQP